MSIQLPATTATEIKQRLIAQMTGNVRWREIMEKLPSLGITESVEVGPGNVLSGLLKRTCREISLKRVGTLAELEQEA